MSTQPLLLRHREFLWNLSLTPPARLCLYVPKQIIRDVLVARAPPAGLLWPLQLARAYALLLYGALMALLRFLLVELPVRVLTGVPRRVADWATGRNSGWVGH